jgi:hypothetical protein
VGDAGMNELKQHASTLNHASMSAKNLHGSRQITHPLYSKSSDIMDNNESDFSVRTKQNVHSSWTTDIVRDKYLSMLQQQPTMFQNDEKKMVSDCSQCFIGNDWVTLSSRNATVPRDGYFKYVKQSGLQPRCS